MELIREVVEAFVRLIKAEVHTSAVLVSADDIFEIAKSPSLILHGPTISEDAGRRSLVKMVAKHVNESTFEERNRPRLYHLDFDLIATTATEGELLDMMEGVARFYQVHPMIMVGDHGTLNLTELVSLGGLKRVNLSNLRQASGRCRIEDCPVFDGRVIIGPLVKEILLDIKA